jgi:tetratricopeptide (TPR) repeat protein
VNARLLEAGSGGSVWSQRWDKPAGQLFDIQDSIVGAIDNSLGSAWTGVIAATDRANARRRPTESLAAYELFLLGVEHKHRFNPTDFAKARDHLERAVQLDPGFAKAWAALSIVHLNRQNFAKDEDSRQTEIAARRRAIAQAHRADPDDPDALIQYSVLLAMDGDTSGAQKALRRAVFVAPNNADVLAVAAIGGSTRCPLGEEPFEWAQRAQKLNPNAPNWYYIGLGKSALYSKRYALAVEALEKAPDIPVRWWNAAAAPALHGDLAAARRAVKRLLELNPGAGIRQIVADRSEWGNLPALALFLEGARLAGMPE